MEERLELKLNEDINETRLPGAVPQPFKVILLFSLGCSGCRLVVTPGGDVVVVLGCFTNKKSNDPRLWLWCGCGVVVVFYY